MAALPDFPRFDCSSEPTSLGLTWKKWVVRLENLFVALNIKADERKKALMLYYGGEELVSIYETLDVKPADTFEVAKQHLNKFFEPKVNLTYETYHFRNLVQGEDETIDKYVTRLKEAASRCEFHDVTREIKDQVVQKTSNDRLRRKALRDDPSLDNLLAAARAMELSSAQAAIIEEERKVNKVGKPGKYSSRREEKVSKQYDGYTNKMCFSCGEDFPHKGGRKGCPAQGLKCGNCGKYNHLTKMCKSKKTNAVTDSFSDESASDDDYCFSTNTIQSIHKVASSKTPNTKTRVGINDVPIKMQIDSGSDVNTITEDDFQRLRKDVSLKPPRLVCTLMVQKPL